MSESFDFVRWLFPAGENALVDSWYPVELPDQNVSTFNGNVEDYADNFLTVINDYVIRQNEASQASADRAMEFSSEQAKLQREFNSREAEKARSFSADMSNTAYQRAMEDLKAAGLNPKLVGQLGGASTPSSSSASIGSSPSGVSASMAQGQVQALSGLLSTYVSNAAALDRQQNDFTQESIWNLINIVSKFF